MAISIGSNDKTSLVSEINITPFVDVVLVLLVIFMVTAPMISRGVTVDLPRTRAGVMEEDESKLLLTITCDVDDEQGRCATWSVQLGEQPVPDDRLEVAIRTNERLQREREVYLQGDRRVPYGFVVHVMAILREAGIDRIGLVTDPVNQSGEPASARAAGEETQG